MNSPKVTICTAVMLESKAVIRALRDVNSNSVQHFTVGIGAKNLPASTDQPAIIIMAGLAGGLDPSLLIGDVVLDDPGNMVQTSAFRRGHIHSTDHIVSTPQQKADLFRSTGASCVDMESDRVRKWASKMNVPFIGIRAISDIASEPLDPAVLGLVDDMGRAKPLAIATTVIRRPSLVPYLKRLGDQSKLAANNLGIAVRSIIDELRKTEMQPPSRQEAPR